MRVLLEVPAARLAARRRTLEDIGLLRGTIPPDDPPLDTQSEFVHNRDFHATLIECCGNALLRIAAQPVFSALQTSLSRSGLGRSFHTAIHAHHAQDRGGRAGSRRGRCCEAKCSSTSSSSFPYEHAPGARAPAG